MDAALRRIFRMTCFWWRVFIFCNSVNVIGFPDFERECVPARRVSVIELFQNNSKRDFVKRDMTGKNIVCLCIHARFIAILVLSGV
jgi:hypothetical protein